LFNVCHEAVLFLFLLHVSTFSSPKEEKKNTHCHSIY
jgi:hypothetical protein